ncbi:MAG: helix-turn-helix transcriptional regulator [Colwellia sp.]|nr:helix-turn-helix transcriptional regulator [Colwellia sp.]
MSISFGEKLKLIRSTTGLSQQKFSDLIGLGISSYKKNEGGFTEVGSITLQKVATHPACNKYALWLISDTTNPESGQIAPGDIDSEQALKNEALSQDEFDKEFIKTVGDSLLMFCHLGWFTPDKDNKKVFDDSGTLILKDVRSLIESRYQTSSKAIKSA